MCVLLLTLNIKDMKKLLFCIVLSIVASGVGFAQSAKELAKERKELIKASKSELNRKASKDARKDAKKYRKEGWKTVPGALPMEKQLDRVYLMQYELAEDMSPKYIMGEGMSDARHYDAAKVQAMEIAKNNVAGQIQTEVTALIETTVANEQLSADEAVSVTRTVMASKNLIVQSLGYAPPFVELYRTLDNKNKVVLVRVAYNREMAKKIAQKVVKEELEKRGEALHDKLDKALGW